MITKAEINKFEKIIDTINSLENEQEKRIVLQKNIEDVEYFLATMKKVNKKNLGSSRKIKSDMKAISVEYTKDEVRKIFLNYKLQDINKIYTLKEIKQMYITIFESKPISSYTKDRVIQTIYNYLYAMNRANELLK